MRTLPGDATAIPSTTSGSFRVIGKLDARLPVVQWSRSRDVDTADDSRMPWLGVSEVLPSYPVGDDEPAREGYEKGYQVFIVGFRADSRYERRLISLRGVSKAK